MKKLVSIQDISCFGQCSLTVALPVLSAYGVETAILPSAILSTHTCGFKDFTVLDLTDEMPKIVNHWIAEGITLDAIYTGYIGDTRQFDLILDAKEKLLSENGKLIVDPAMADHGMLYPALGEDIVNGMRSIVKKADIILPNLTEAAFLLEKEYKESYTEPEIKEMLKALEELGPEISILTGVSYEEGKIGAAAYVKSTGEFIEYFAEKQEKGYHGTGDIFSSVAIANLVNGKSIYDSLADACEFIVRCIKNTEAHPEHGYGVCFESVLAERM